MSSPGNARSNAQRQADYKARMARDGRRLDIWLSTSDRLALQRLAKRDGVSQAETVAQLVRAADLAATAGLSDAEVEEYFGVTR